MKLRTISQLPQVNPEDSLPSESLIEIALPAAVVGGTRRYTSKAARFDVLKDGILSGFQDRMNETYGLVDPKTDRPIELDVVRDAVTELSTGTCTLAGRKTFSTPIAYKDPDDVASLNDNDLVTKSQARELSREYGNYISPKTTYVNSDPENTTPNTQFNDEHFMKWQFDQDGRDSEEFILDPYSNQRAKPVFATYSGNLVVYGWLADNGNVAPQEAWVALFGKVNIGNQDSEVKRWVALQVQPWIIGAKSQSLQYVGFNVPVKKGMQLKIMTGFPVNVMNSGFQDPRFNTLTLTSNQPCTFVGYVLRND